MTTAELIARHPVQWKLATTHSFLEGARDGSLDEEIFGQWLEQDRLFVVGLARAWGRLLAAAPLADFEIICAGLSAFTAELAWFDELAFERELSLDIEPSADAASYIGFLTELVDAPYPVAITAMWAVEAAYLHAWQGALGGTARYAAIVEHWANPDFATFVDELGAAVDRELAGAPKQQGAAEKTFVRVLEHEASFWAVGGAA